MTSSAMGMGAERVWTIDGFYVQQGVEVRHAMEYNDWGCVIHAMEYNEWGVSCMRWNA